MERLISAQKIFLTIVFCSRTNAPILVITTAQTIAQSSIVRKSLDRSSIGKVRANSSVHLAGFNFKKFHKESSGFNSISELPHIVLYTLNSQCYVMHFFVKLILNFRIFVIY